MYFLDFGDFQIAGASPEPLLTVYGPPRSPRGRSPAPGRAAPRRRRPRIAEELLADPKERAEHVMLVDLGRNDLGRVAEYGTVHVRHLHGRGDLLPRDAHRLQRLRDAAAGDRGDGRAALRAARRDALGRAEGPGHGDHRRARAGQARRLRRRDRLPSYTGDLDTCIHIRTVVVADGVAHVQAGGGTVADAKPAYEYEESRAKSRARAAGDRARARAAGLAVSEGSTAEVRREVEELMRARDDGAADASSALAWGAVLLTTPSVPLVWDLNHVRVEDPAAARRGSRWPRPSAAASRRSCGSTPSGRRAARAGARRARFVTPPIAADPDRAALRRRGARPRPARPRRDPPPRPPTARSERGSPAHARSHRARWRRAAETLALGVLESDGTSPARPGSTGTSAVAQIEDVNVLSARRGRGLGRALIAGRAPAPSRPRELAFIMADANDWPRRLLRQAGVPIRCGRGARPPIPPPGLADA